MSLDYGMRFRWKGSIAFLAMIGLWWSSAVGENSDWENAISPPDLAFHVEAGDDLSGWGNLGQEFVVSELMDETDGTKTVTVRDSVPINQRDQRFLKVRVEMVGE
jgi:hypothetical protein